MVNRIRHFQLQWVMHKQKKCIWSSKKENVVNNAKTSLAFVSKYAYYKIAKVQKTYRWKFCISIIQNNRIVPLNNAAIFSGVNISKSTREWVKDGNILGHKANGNHDFADRDDPQVLQTTLQENEPAKCKNKQRKHINLRIQLEKKIWIEKIYVTWTQYWCWTLVRVQISNPATLLKKIMFLVQNEVSSVCIHVVRSDTSIWGKMKRLSDIGEKKYSQNKDSRPQPTKNNS